MKTDFKDYSLTGSVLREMKGKKEKSKKRISNVIRL